MTGYDGPFLQEVRAALAQEQIGPVLQEAAGRLLAASARFDIRSVLNKQHGPFEAASIIAGDDLLQALYAAREAYETSPKLPDDRLRHAAELKRIAEVLDGLYATMSIRDIAIALLQDNDLEFHQQESVGRLVLADAAMQRVLWPEPGDSFMKYLDELGPLESAFLAINTLFTEYKVAPNAERLQNLIGSLEEHCALCWNELARLKRLDAEGHWDDPEEVRRRWLAPDDDSSSK